jgi:peptidoglycan-associated lipoprotein
MKHQSIWLAAALAAGGMAVSACATHEYVDTQNAAQNTQNEQQFASVNARVDAVNGDAQLALARAEAANKLATGDMQHTVLFTDDSVKFDTNSSDLSADSQASLTAFADKIKSENKNVYIEIQGHADGRGSVAYNNALAQARADAVLRFLNTQGLPLSNMNHISYGESKPTGKGEDDDRRAVLIVMD